jgi:hypothetical protein
MTHKLGMVKIHLNVYIMEDGFLEKLKKIKLKKNENIRIE